jgi:hypothetical protein
MRNRLVFVVTLLLTLLLALPAAAQDPTVFCGNLAAADCELLTANAEASKNLSSAALTISGELGVVGIPNTPDMNFSLDGSGGYSFDRAAMDALMTSMMGAQGGTPDYKALVQALLDALKGLDAELKLTIVVPEAIAEEMDLPASTIVLDAKFVDGIAYLNFDELDKLTGGMLAQQGMKGWLGINFSEIADKALEENAAMFDQLGTMAGASTMMGNPADYEMFAKYLQVARTDSGGGDAEFTMNLDFAGMFSDPAFMDLLKKQMAAQGNTMTDAQLQQMGPMMAMFSQGLTFEVITRINPDSKQTTHLGLNMKFDMATIMAMSGQAGSGESSVSLVLNIDYSGHNATSVTAPAGAQVAPSEMFLPMLAGGSR